MFQKISVRWLSFLLAIVMIVVMLPLNVFAAGSVSTFDQFTNALKVLETYADDYSATSGKDANLLVINFIRTGVDRYNDGNWKTLAGEEITEFTAYVEAQDASNGTNAMDLRDIVIDDFKLPNGNLVDFGHMFGTLNIAYVAAVASADLGGWAGDLCDLLLYSHDYGNVPEGTIEEMAEYIRINCFGVNADDAFGMDDFYGDMDAYYLNNMAKAGKKLSTVMADYFTADLTDADRAAYFLNNRFNGLETRDDVRAAILGTYTANTGLKVLEADRGLSGLTDLRTACCYAFADYLFNLAGDRLEGGSGEEEEVDNPYYSIFSSTESILAPGITQTINYAQTADNKQIVYYVATVDVTREDVTIMANYKDNNPGGGWGMQRVEDQANALLNNYKDQYDNFNVIVATNADGYNMSTGQPGGLLVMNGVEWHPVDGDGFFAILKDGTAMIGTKAEYAAYKDQIQEAVGAFGATLVKDGKMAVNKNSSYYSTRASRTAIGITADGKVVMMVLDGRQEPFSCGGSMEEIAQIMLDAGCVEAVNLDGGGSTTYLSKPEGGDKLQLVNRPSDGYARSVATSLVAISTAKSSNEFDHANIASDYDYLTIGTSLPMFANGVSNTGNTAPIPAGAVWQVTDESIGSITADGVFTALDNGEVEVQLIADGIVVGSKKIYVVIPDTLSFTQNSMNIIYGIPTKLPLQATYCGNVVAINEYDIYAGGEYEEAAIFEGYNITAVEESGIRTMLIAALLLCNEDAVCSMRVSMYSADEAYFDFDNATAGNRTLAWLREVNNTTTKDDMLYQIVTPGEDMGIEYTFGLDMTSIEIPSQLADLVYMLPGADAGATAWDFLLQLAERVSVLTEVKISVQLDTDLDVDVSELRVSNEYFKLKSYTLDENNVLTVTCGWVDQTQAIDSATANPICILSGLKAVPKDGAEWDSEDQLIIKNTGTVSYRIYLRASSLYSFANNAENQAQYGLLPYSGDRAEFYYDGQPLMYGEKPEQGAYFGSTYADFEDTFILDKTNRQGWVESGDELSYFVNNVAVTGIQYLNSLEDPTVKLYYNFDEDGICQGPITGVFEHNGGIYYAIKGVRTTGWLATYDDAGNAIDYYFDPRTGMAVDGVQTIQGYTYTFTNYILTRGDFVTDATGSRYRWAGKWVHGTWFVVDGNTYHTAKYQYYVTTGFASVLGKDLNWKWHLFDENGVFQENYTGLWKHEGETYYIVNGLRDSTVGLVYEGGYYYFISSANAKAYRNGRFWINHTHGMIPAGFYTFDDEGRIIDPPAQTPVVPETPDTPDTPDVTYDGIVEINGVLYYYKDNVPQYSAGLIKLTDDAGVEFYIYVRSNAQLAIGNYWITTTNGLLEAGMYTFDANGRYYPASEEPDTPVVPDEPEVLDGIVEIDGILYYYENNVIKRGLGVLKMADENGRTFYIYVRSNGQLATGVYWPTTRNDLLPRGAYDWGTDGRYYPAVEVEPETPVEPVVKNGIVEENGVLYYYIDGTCAYGAGVLKLTDDAGVEFYIYVRSNGQLATGKYWPTNRNDLLPRGEYDWGEDGRLYL